MKTSESIANTIDRLPNGFIFTYIAFTTEVNSKEAIVKALNRLVAEGKINKLSKGKYYKPEKTVFGLLEPSQREVVKDINPITKYKLSGVKNVLSTSEKWNIE